MKQAKVLKVGRSDNENGIAEIVDIKYASIACGTSDRQYCSLTAMLIYKTA